MIEQTSKAKSLKSDGENQIWKNIMIAFLILLLMCTSVFSDDSLPENKQIEGQIVHTGKENDMSELNSKLKQAENEMDEVIKRRVYGNGATNMTGELRKRMIEIISSCKDMAISTVREDGWPQNNTVGFVNIEETIYMQTFTGSSKAKNIARDPRVSIAICPPYENVANASGISMAAYAEKVTDEATNKEINRLLLVKMPELTEIKYNDGTPVYPDPHVTNYRLRPYVISILDFEKGFGHADLVMIGDETAK